MTVSFQELPERTETVRLHERLQRLRASMAWASEAISVAVRDEVMASIGRCEERLALGVDLTVVALAGGTGSGKSSLFNALTQTNLAEVSAARPTTSEVAAAAWGEADALLDWIEVSPAKRARLGSPEGLAGVVLLDLPDHDSINEHNRSTVDRVVPRADLIVWVVDPQKYADHALHSAYLRVASDHGQPSLVVLNQVDRLSADDAETVAQDLARLVALDGIAHAPVLKVSASTGDGVPALRAELAAAAGARSVAAEAVRADLVAAGRALEKALAREAEPTLPDPESLVAALARAAGVDALADAAAAIAAAGASRELSAPAASYAAVEQVRLEWIDAATVGLPLPWRIVLDDAVLGAHALTDEVNAALAAEAWSQPSSRGGIGLWWSKATKGRRAADEVRAAGKRAVRAAVVARVLEPTEMIHQAYRNLDELTELS